MITPTARSIATRWASAYWSWSIIAPRLCAAIAVWRSCSTKPSNAFVRDGDNVFRTYFINVRGDEAMGSTWSYLDLTAFGRQEEWEDSPDGYPQTAPYEWWIWHDEPHRT